MPVKPNFLQDYGKVADAIYPPPSHPPAREGGNFFFGFITYTSPCRSHDPDIDPDGPQHLIATKNGWKQRRENEGAPRGRIPNHP